MTTAGRRTRVLLADDSRVHRELLTALFTGAPGFDVVGVARDGAEAVRMVAAVRPDVAVLDLHMPEMDGLEATRRSMRDTPVPIVITSAISDLRDVRRSFECHQAGAVASLCKPGGPGAPGSERDAAALISTVRLMADVRVIRRRERGDAAAPAVSAPAVVARPGAALEVLAIGTSTGGPSALAAIFGALGADYPLPILCVQHIADGWIEGFAGWLAGLTALRVRVAVHGEPLARGSVYLAPEDRHLGVCGRSVQVSDGPRVGVFRPSCDFLFESVARAFGPRGAVLVLTGMGSDGLAGARHVRAAGGRVIAQDRESSVVHGMPGVVITERLAHAVLALDQIATYLRAMVVRPEGDGGG